MGWGLLSDQQSTACEQIYRLFQTSTTPQQTLHECTLFYKAVMFYCWNCRWLSHLERFKCIFLHYIMQGFIFVLIWDLVTAFSITMQFSSGLVARQLCEWAVVPPVPADPAVTALLIIFGPQLPDSRTEHVRIRSTEQTRGPQTELLRPTFIRLIISCFHRNRLAA